MKITVTAAEPKDNKLEATLTVAAADVDAAIKKAYKDIANKYRFQGFRKGKAPRPVIDGLVGKDNVLAEASEDVLNEATPLMLDELDIVPVGQPTYGDEPVLVSEGSDYVVTATISLRPDCELESYDAPEVNMPPEEATEAEIDWQLNQLLSYQMTYEDTDEDREVAEGDVIGVDIQNVEGAGHLAAENRTVTLNGMQLPAELQEAIVGMKPGETKDVEWVKSHEHEGEVHEHKFSVKVTVKAIKKAVTPELTDELAKKNFGYETVEKLREAVKEEIEADKKTSLPQLKEDRVVEEMGKRLQLDEVPENYKNEIFNELAQEFLAQLQRQNISLDMYLAARGVKADDFIADLHAQADERARQSLALDAVAKKMGFEATEADVEAEFERAGIEDVKDAVKQWKDQGRLPAIRDSIKRTKALDYLVENAKVTVKDEVAERAEAQKAESAE